MAEATDRDCWRRWGGVSILILGALNDQARERWSTGGLSPSRPPGPRAAKALVVGPRLDSHKEKPGVRPAEVAYRSAVRPGY